MKRIPLLFALIINSLALFSQNWMMAQHYAAIFADSVIAGQDSGKMVITRYKYAGFTYDSLKREFALTLKDISPSAGDEKNSAAIITGLTGGSSVFVDNLLNFFEAELPDYSHFVYIWNNTGIDISFSLSCNDADFYSYSLKNNTYYWYNCENSGLVYIKMSTLTDGKETGQVHYKLTRGNGYKVEWNKTTRKYDVFLDNRI